MKISKILTALTLILAFATCKKDTKKEENPVIADLTKNVSNIQELNVPSSFNYQTTKNINITLQVADVTFGNKLHLIFIYDGNPDVGGSLIASGSASIENTFTSNIKLPTSITNIYVARIKPNGERVLEMVAAQSGTITHTMSLNKNGLNKKPGPDCSSGCTTTINNQSNQNLNLSSGVTCITGTFSGEITLTGTAILRVCGNAIINKLNLNSTSVQAIFTSTSTVLIDSNLETKGTMTNYGNLTVNGELKVKNASTFTNEGAVTINYNVEISENSTATNNGVMVCKKYFTVKSDGTFTNNCKLVVEDKFETDGIIVNNGYILCLDKITIKKANSQSFTQNNGAMIHTADIEINGNINGTGTTSLIKVSGNTKILTYGSVTGSQQFCDLNGIESNSGIIGGGATIACSVSIPVTSCNTEGNNATSDTDGDGVYDTYDAYPTDPTRAFNNYYPSASNYATVSYEDLWPFMGDYDINDVVVDFRHNIVTNAQNKVVDMRSKFIYRAHGGNQTTAFAIELPTALSNINTSSLTKTISPTQPVGVLNQVQFETLPSKAVLQLFNNSYNMPYWNTVIGDVRADTMVYYVQFNFTSAYTAATTLNAFGGVNEFNPFIYAFRPDRGRGYEIHLPGKDWTSLADLSVFGYADDNTNPSGSGVKYKSKNNLPFAILTPTRFEYPVEVRIAPVPQVPLVDITQIYLRFAQWSQSGGTLYPDWYSNTNPGYRTAQPWIYTY